MHPAFSVIFFTVSSGTGYGLLAILGVFEALGLLPSDVWFVLASIVIALVAITAGLLSSTFHLGRPERAWRAFSQWRSSWLSREGVAAVLSYGPALLLLGVWVWPDLLAGFRIPAALATVGMAIITVYCTAMIYRSLKTIPEWHNNLTVLNYLAHSGSAGSIWLFALAALFGHDVSGLLPTVLILIGISWALKVAYWRHIDQDDSPSSPGTATGLDRFGTVRRFETPHTEDNYLLKEMGYQLARARAGRLRLYAQGLGFLLPILLLIISIGLSPAGHIVVAIGAALSMTLGLLIERWLVFAQARHVVTHFYGPQAG